MFRNAARRALPAQRALTKVCSPSISIRLVHSGLPRAAFAPRSSATGCHGRPLPLTTYKPMTALVRYYAAPTIPGTTQRTDKEQEFAQRAIQPSPESVSASSSVSPVFAPREEEEDVPMMAGVRHDIKVIRETFALDEVPVQAYRLGLAGVLPYLATSSATVLCAYEINTAAHYGSGYLMSMETAQTILAALEPIQIGYGAVILSFLGAIHWGLEWAGYGGYQGYKRYAIGVIAPAVAWPTILMPVEYALITQFLAFNIFYAVDGNVTTKGWTPPWYQTYRFILTFVVGASIVFSLVGRGMIVDQVGPQVPATSKRIQAIRDRSKQEEVRKADQDAEAEEAADEEE